MAPRVSLALEACAWGRGTGRPLISPGRRGTAVPCPPLPRPGLASCASAPHPHLPRA